MQDLEAFEGVAIGFCSPSVHGYQRLSVIKQDTATEAFAGRVAKALESAAIRFADGCGGLHFDADDAVRALWSPHQEQPGGEHAYNPIKFFNPLRNPAQTNLM